MPRVPTPYSRNDDDQPTVRLTFKARHGQSTVRVLEYPNGDVCVQLEDKVSGAEMWTDRATVVRLGETLVKLWENA